MTEVFRFADGPIDGIHPVTGVEGPEGRINAWPVDEAFLDSVEGSPRAGLISDLAVPMTAVTLAGSNGAADESHVTLGYHAIEFLLWGQDKDTTGAGDRPVVDFRAGDPVRDRRRACLALLADLLVADLGNVAQQWAPGPDRYVGQFLALTRREAFRRALTGAATLAGFELAAERIGVPLATGAQEDELSCFSDNTHRDLAANIAGIALVLEGDAKSPGLLPALDALDPECGRDLRARLERVRFLTSGIAPPFDAVLRAPSGDPRRRALQALAGELIGLAGALSRAGETAGVRVAIGGG